MPKLVDEDGNVVMDGLSVGELQQLEEYSERGEADIDWDLPEEELDSTAHQDPQEAKATDKPDEIIKTDVPTNPAEVDHRLGPDPDGEKPDKQSSPDRESYHYDDVDSPDETKEVAERDEKEIEHNFDIDIEVIEKVDTRDRDRWARLVRKLSEYGDDIQRRKRERDGRITSFRNRACDDRHHEFLKRKAEQNNVIADLKSGFEQLVSRPVPRPATVGPQIDPMNVARRAAGDMTIRELFEESVEVETGSRCIGLCTDISASMRSDIDDLKIAGGVIAEATKIIGDKFVWEAFTDRHGNHHTPSRERLDLRIVTGPNETFDWRHLDSFDHADNTSTPSGIRDTHQLMQKTSVRQYVMIVITDGMANVNEDGEIMGTGEPVEQARQAVRECRHNGVDVIGLGIGSMSDEQMENTFGKGNYELTTIDDLAEHILRLYEDQMNVSR